MKTTKENELVMMTNLNNLGEVEKDENPERGNWKGRFDFILSCIGYAVGLGNVWRFPYLCYRNGGGAFLIPYATMLFLAGIPLFYLELSFGQYAGEGPITAWKICPLFKGAGYSMIVISGLVMIYYNVIIAYALYYMYLSFTALPSLPWVGCDHEWNTPACFVPNGTWYNGSWYDSNAVRELGIPVNTTGRVPPAQEFWSNFVLKTTDGVENLGGIRTELAIALIIAWTIVFLCLIRGVKSSGKVVYFTATFPYIILIILLGRGCSLPGSYDGILFYLTPNWDLLLTAQVWGDAAVQIFYSLGLAFGGLLTMSSYNKFHNNCFRDALLVPIINCGTSVFAGFAVFSILGFLSYETGVKIEDVVDSGPGLAFVAYPEAIARLPVSPLWAFLFFFMLLTLGLDSQFAMVETVVSGLIDEFSEVLRPRKTLFSIIVCMICLLIGLAIVTEGGIFVFQMFDWYSAGISLMVVSFLECITIGWIYGANRFTKDITQMVGYRPLTSPWWILSWVVITPITVMFIVVFSLVQYTPVTYNGYIYPKWAELIGWLMTVLAIIMIPIFMCIQIYKAEGSGFIEKIRNSLTPTAEWNHLEDNDKDSNRFAKNNSGIVTIHSPYSTSIIGDPYK